METKIELSIEDAILEEAEKLFMEKGFTLTSTTQIADAVGCNQAMVHYYYRTKERLFEAVFEKKLRLFVSHLLEIGDENIPFQEKLRKKIESHFDMIRANPKLPFLIFNELTTNPQRILSFQKKIGELPKAVIGQLDEEVKDAIAKGIIRPIETIDLAMTIISLNIILFIMSPIFRTALQMTDEEFEKLVIRRKRENVTTILAALRP